MLGKQRVDEEAAKGVPEQERFSAISFRPGTLTEKAAGGVRLGHGPSRGDSSREGVAKTVVEVLAKGAKGWIDMLDGEEEIGAAVDKLVKEGVDSVDEEDFEAMKERAAKF